ncbi:MAG: putative aminopeptidase [Cyclobacteriaceae bacterium]|jgi:predicted aminopeptidase
MFKKIWVGTITILLMLIIWQWSFILYGINQAKGQIEVIRNAKPIDTFLEDPSFPDSLKQKLTLAKEVRIFAMNDLKLNQSDNYTTMYDQKGKTILWNLSACEPYELKAYTWYYPFLGSMPYKGFFDLEKAKLEKEKLEQLGYDARIRPVGGWSTLGILNDPILSDMLNRSDGALAEVIIHELTHATIFVKNEIEFNENLASFIGEQGAVIYLKQKHGEDHLILQEYYEESLDGKRLTAHVLKGAQILDSLYSHMAEQPDAIKKTLKEKTINEIVESIDTVSFFNQRYYGLFEKTKPNNAYFMSFMRYHSQEDTLTSIYNQYDSDLMLMIENLKELYGK